MGQAELIVPEYAISYLYYGSKDGLSDEDVKIIDKWMADENLAESVDCGEERFFSSRLEFGLPTTCVEVSFLKRSRMIPGVWNIDGRFR